MKKTTSFIKAFLGKCASYSDYDRLIQLCDSIAIAIRRVCLMEKRLVDVVLRHGVNPLTVHKWKALMQIFEEFQIKNRRSALFPVS